MTVMSESVCFSVRALLEADTQAAWVSLAVMVRLLRSQRLPTPFITLIPSQARSREVLSDAEVVASVCTNWKCAPWLSLAVMVRLL